MHSILLALVCLVALAALPAAELLANPGLTANAASWNLPAGVASLVDGKAIDQAGPVLCIAAAAPGWHMANQWSLPLPAGAKSVKLSAWVKIEGITPGANAWDQPRLMVMFHDAKGTQAADIGVVEIPAGDGWREVAGTVAVPAGVVTAAFCIGLHNCTGTMWITTPSCQSVE